MTRHAPLLALAALAAILFAAPTPAGACGDTPKAAVERFQTALLAATQNAAGLDREERFARLDPELTACFDLDLMVRVATGSYWRGADAGARERLTAAFRRMSVSSYVAQLGDFAEESFEIVGERSGPQGTRMVATHILSPGEDPVGMTYVMKERGGTWRIADVLLDDDISQLATRRSEYRRVLATDGVEGLITSLEAKTKSLLAEN